MHELKDLRPSSVTGISAHQLARALDTTVHSGPAETLITGVTLDSTDVQPGDLFVAIPGFKRHGAEFAAKAIAAGAVAVVTDAAGISMLAGMEDIAMLRVSNPRVFAGLAAALVYGNPGKSMRVVGITGTNGKTTTAHFVHHVLAALSGPTLLIGTVGVSLGEVHVSSARTSLEAPVLHRVLAWALERGAQNVVMEVSSHALSLHRVAGLKFDVSAFLNLQRDHLDFHKTMESYFEAKASLFAADFSKRAVICIDDGWGERLAQMVRIPTVTVATKSAADWQVVSHSLNQKDAGTDVTIRAGEADLRLHCPLPGMINVQNELTALAVLVSLGFEASSVCEELARTPGVPGRMEVVAERSSSTPLVIVDFAHTADAIKSACAALDPVTPGSLWILFGATGERDRGKRPVMGAAALSSADYVVLTDDDIYGEDPAQIRAEVAAGFAGIAGRARSAWESDDRKSAIHEAVLAASPDDTVLIAGRGHETIQMVGEKAHVLDDRVEARVAVSKRSVQNQLGEVGGEEKTACPKLRTISKTWEDFQ
ncbi:UDP-N-acetylmuramoyl-L-alanyl-D-glutamate--2,6-diaminopimelate ligase [uncultured Actinomyces sp.]|uniref:UDP-N-acetylmuramoyl-L-alanyl-D-glutamate--2, 6-diaminopimelate ligase n=1 Tax=uncultured Actinomyces sp. TaxID=249061 RepID=UPI00262B10EC|nr:UDP-N-acetylmuramoyl-L-alanyl-D-glutamate--2,6-diaminopimelate ligase [uncultured Actinomyces sp.]